MISHQCNLLIFCKKIGYNIDIDMDEIPIEANRDFIRSFILNGQERIREIIIMSEIHSEDEDNGMGMML